MTNFGIYSAAEEENIRLRKSARSWQRSGLITEEQLRIIDGRAGTQLRQTNLFFRILFFIFTLVCTAAVIGFFFWIIRPAGETAISLLLLVFASAAYGLAEYLVRTKKLYRYGMEEALAAESVFLCCAAFAMLIFRHAGNHSAQAVMTASLCSLLSFWLFVRFGYLYGAVAGYLALCSVPFHLNLSASAVRVSLLLFLSAAFAVHALYDRAEKEDFRRFNHAVIAACLFCGIYLAVNLRLPALGHFFFMPAVLPPFGGVSPALYWASYFLAFLVPAAGLYYGLKRRRRLMIIAGSVAAVVTLATNKDYLGMEHYSWDPAVMGMFLAAGALMISRWLAKGGGKSRFGFTAENILKPEHSGIDLAALGAAAVPGLIDAPQPQPRSPSAFGGGDSGGGGADDGY